MKLIMLSVTLVKYSVRCNGGNIGPIVPQRGLRQGDPISLYIFLICAEGLTSLLYFYARQGLFHGYIITKSGPAISHLFFSQMTASSFSRLLPKIMNMSSCVLSNMKKPPVKWLILISPLFYSALMLLKRPILAFMIFCK